MKAVAQASACPVVLVTTVKGSKDRPAKISYDYFFGVQNIYKNLDPLNAQEYMYILDAQRYTIRKCLVFLMKSK